MRAELTESMLARAYRAGIFPMAESVGAGALSWYDPDPRGILPLDRFHLPRRLFRTVRANGYRVTADTAFPQVVAACAAATPERPESWINAEIARLFASLHRAPVDGARAHSVECWLDAEANGDGTGPVLAGGLYGLAIGRAFFGESMFSRARDASKVALVHLVARLRLSGFVLLDTQFITAHLSQFGATEVSRRRYRRLLAEALSDEVRSGEVRSGETGSGEIRAGEIRVGGAGWIDQPSPSMLRDEIASLAAAGGRV